MAIPLDDPNASTGPGTDPRLEAAYRMAIDFKQQGAADKAVERKLREQGLDEEAAQVVVRNVNRMISEHRSHHRKGRKSGIPSWLIWIALLILINVLAVALDWPFFIY